VSERAGDRVRPGPILDEQGRVVGRHDGVFRFTRGQRKNLGVALGKRMYVVDVDAERASVKLGSREALLARAAMLTDVRLFSGPLPLECDAVVRYRGSAARATLRRDEGKARLDFDVPVAAVVPGQFAVLHRGDLVLGGGIIEAAVPA
jgi:tRNA-uridine 2-sulfurtransferase